MENYSESMGVDYNERDFDHSYSHNLLNGYYEDVLFANQQKVPANTFPVAQNPYIQDDIAKSQRHSKPRTQSVENRAETLTRKSQYDHVKSPSYFSASHFGGSEKNGNFEIAPMTVLIIFVFLVLLFFVFSCWRSIEELRYKLGGIVESMKVKSD